MAHWGTPRFGVKARQEHALPVAGPVQTESASGAQAKRKDPPPPGGDAAAVAAAAALSVPPPEAPAGPPSPAALELVARATTALRARHYA
jgi:hypothetical protein